MRGNWIFPTAFKSWGPEEHAAIARVIVSDRFTMGPEVEAFEGEFALYHGRKHAIMVNSGSSANEIAFAAAALQCHPTFYEGGDWAQSASVPAIAWSTTYAPAWRHGYGRFDMRDVDDSWNAPLPPLRVRGYAHSWSNIYVCCSILGCPIEDAEKIPLLKKEHPLKSMLVIEDNCEALGARDESGRRTGTFGDMATFSFYHSHQISAIEGGMILTDDDELARLCRLLRNHGNDGWGSEDFDTSYRFCLFAYNLRPTEMHAAIAREQLKKLDGFIAERRRNLAHFTDLAASLPVKPQETQGQPSPFGLAFTVENGERRRVLLKALRAEGIDSRLPTGGSFSRHPYGRAWADQPTPNADRIHDTGLFLGNAPYDISPLIERAVAVMRKTL